MNLTYKFTSKYTHRGKLNAILQVARVYQNYYNILMTRSINDFYRTGKIPLFLSPVTEFSDFSERYKQTCGKQIRSTINSLLSNIKNKITLAISKSSLDPDTKVLLHYINKYQLWFRKSVVLKDKEIPLELLKLSRRMFKQFKGEIPRLRNITMLLDQKVATIEKSKNSFDYWIKLSTLEKGKPIYLPIKSYDYFEFASGELQKQAQIIIKKGQVEYGFIKESEDVSLAAENKIVGIDLGMSVLLASSEGNQYGRSLFKKLKHYDEIITRMSKKQNKQGLKKSLKLDRLYSKVKNIIKNEVGRVLNRFLKKEKPDLILMEHLTGLTQNTQSSMSRKMRRLLNNCGMSKIPGRLETKSKRVGFKIEKINPAYTSKECPRCHHIEKNNRKDQPHFKCVECGFKRNADYVGSINIRDRRSIPSISIYTPYKSVPGLIGDFYSGQSSSYRPNYRPAVARESVGFSMLKERCVSV